MFQDGWVTAHVERAVALAADGGAGPARVTAPAALPARHGYKIASTLV
ncbi:hypothetical protein [Streptomyces sulfonofaciens]|nr:hypothetical protein [Streptomyces sulfonofaciens]